MPLKVALNYSQMDESKNAINIVVQNKSEEIISEISKTVSDMGMIAFEIGEEIQPM